MMHILPLDADMHLHRCDRENSARGYAYIVGDVVGRRVLCVTQKLPFVAAYLRESGVDDCKTSSLYDACLRDGQLYRNRFLVKKVSLEHAVQTFNEERRARAYEASIVATAQPSLWKATVSRPHPAPSENV